MNRTCLIQSNSDVRPTSIECAVADDGGLPVQRFVKDLICSGTFRHPRHQWALPVDADRIDRWVKVFDRMSAAGVEVPVVKDHRVTADTTLGYARRFFRDGDTLKCIIEARGRDSIDLVQRVGRVSIGLEPSFVDGKGNEYGEAITHIGVTPIPIVPGQSDMRIAASRGQSLQEPLILLATEDGEHTMDLAKLAKVLGVTSEITEDNALATVERSFSDLRSQITKTKELTEELKALREKLAGIEDKKLDPDVAEEHAQQVQEEVQRIAASLGLTPEDEKAIALALTGPAAARNEYLLSRVSEANAQGIRPIRARVVLDALKRIDPKKLIQVGAKTGPQALTLSRPNGDEPKDATQKDIDARAAAVF